MGGWCAKRGQCPNYHATDRSDPVERYCDKGADGIVTVTATPWNTESRDIFNTKGTDSGIRQH